MSINFSDLKRKDIRVALSDGVVVYNPTPEQKRDILMILTKNAKGNEINIEGEDILLELVPMLTNIKLNLDKEKDKDKINEILEDPDELLEDVVREIKQIVRKISKNAIEIINDLKEMPQEQREKMINKFNQDNDTKKKKIEELKKQLAELENS